MDRAGGAAKPRSESPTVLGQDGSECSSVCGQPAMVGSAVADDQADRDRGRLPAEVLDDLAREPSLPIQRGQDLADINDRGLELEDKQRAGRRVPRQEIDHAAFSPDRERDFRPNDPLGQPADPPGDTLGKGGVSSVDDSLNACATGSREQLDADFEGVGHLAQDPERHLVEVTLLDPDDRSARYLGGIGKILLAPVSVDASRANGHAEHEVVHAEERRRQQSPAAHHGVQTRLGIRTFVRYHVHRTGSLEQPMSTTWAAEVDKSRLAVDGTTKHVD
jgi:hypothetical protein